jgi:hypothetical protein
MNRNIFYVSLLCIVTAGLYIANEMAHTKKKMHYNVSYIIPSSYLLDEHNKPTAELSQLLNILNIKHDGTLASIVKETQQHWLRQAGKERWQVDEICADKKDEILKISQMLGQLDEIAPTKTHYRYAVILGATAKRVRTRLAYLIELYKKGIQFDEIIMLGSDRPLDAEIENEVMLLDTKNPDLACKTNWTFNGALPKTEFEMLKFIYDQADLPAQFKAVPTQIINTPMIKNSNGTMRRPTTEDTIKTFLSLNPKSGDCLFISNQPYVSYQDAVVRTYLPQEFNLETVGSCASPTLRNAELLDNYARTLYQEKIRREKENLKK